MFTEKERQFIAARGSELADVEKQIVQFKSGFPPVELVAAATLEKGIIQLNEKEVERLAQYYDKNRLNFTIEKFVPASGAASRMFKKLFELLDWFDGKEDCMERYYADQGSDSPYFFIENLEKFPFVNLLQEVMERAGEPIAEAIMKKQYHRIVFYLLDEEQGLGYGAKPKALLPFHTIDDNHYRLPLEEHLVEGAAYAADSEGNVKIHFTVSPEHQVAFEERLAALTPAYEQQYNVHFDISISNQLKSSDTIAVTPENTPFIDTSGTLLFRPAGHGALIHNLNALQSDIVFVKNIDNVAVESRTEEAFQYKKALAGLLMERKTQLDRYCKMLNSSALNEELLSEITAFARQQFIVLPEDFSSKSTGEKQQLLVDKLNRPMRVCGMVKNEGEPGGGPYFIKDSKGEISLQIVESAQMNLADNQQKKIVENATHFNPVDLVCVITDCDGKVMNLTDFVNEETGFISSKSKDGKQLKALELPGLWNGAMADWITLFVEVPLSSFNPVKSVNDLLRPMHQ